MCGPSIGVWLTLSAKLLKKTVSLSLSSYQLPIAPPLSGSGTSYPIPLSTVNTHLSLCCRRLGILSLSYNESKQLNSFLLSHLKSNILAEKIALQLSRNLYSEKLYVSTKLLIMCITSTGGQEKKESKVVFCGAL